MCQRCPDLPFLPGFSFNPRIGKTKFNMDPKFAFIAPGVRALVERVKPNILGPLTDRYPSLYPRGEVAELPAWISFDKQILRFDAYFKETLQEFLGSAYQIRKVVIYLFLEDGTIQVMEPKIENSGSAQGTLLSRQRIRFPPPMDFNFYDIIDLNVGREVEFFSRIYKITDCDKFTRVFLNRVGIAVPDPIKVPEDPYMNKRAHEGDALLPKKPNSKVDTLGQFLKNDRKVLRFYGYWDDRETDFGYLHKLEIHYYLADDTIDIKEVVIDNAGIDSSFLFIKRGKLPKLYKGLPGVGAASRSTVLNVLGSGLQARYVLDSLDCGKQHVEYYREQDLAIGGVLNLYGRKVFITDCDPYTKEYYQVKYGVNEFTPVPVPEDQNVVEFTPLKQRELPLWNGYGSYEDSAQNCVTVELTPLIKDIQQFLELDRNGLDSRILRFEARMLSKTGDNCRRAFIISYFLADNTISVFEVAKQNSGFAKSQFLSRREIQLPGQATFLSKPPEYYSPQHMFIGATITINSFYFVLIDADEYAFRYMEVNSHKFPKSNIKTVMDKVREKLRPIYKDFVAENLPTETTTITYEKLRDKLCRIMDDHWTEQEMITIARAFSANCYTEKFDREAVRAITLNELKRLLWDDLERLEQYFIKRDPNRTGLLSKHECYNQLRACRLPLDVELIDRILKVIIKDVNCNLYYKDLIDFLDRTKCPLADVIPINIKYETWWGSDRQPTAGRLIDWCAFNKYLDLEKTFAEDLTEPTINALEHGSSH